MGDVREVMVHLVRHGQSTWNVDRRLQGQIAHPPLTEQGRVDAGRAADELAALIGDEPTSVVTSDLARARQTAEVIAARLGVRAVLDRGLREQHLGTLQGRLTNELTSEPIPDGGHISEVRWGGGESIQDVHGRLQRFFDGWRAAAPRHLVVVTHGDALRVARAVLAGRSHRQVAWDVVPNGAVVTITWRPV